MSSNASRTSVVLSFLLCWMASGCKDDHTTHWVVASYNTGLQASVGYLSQRREALVGALSRLDAQLLCVQEVWEQSDWDDIVAANQDKRPHVLRMANEPGVQGMCTLDEFNPLAACATTECATSSTPASCLARSCTREVAKLSRSCTKCLADNAKSDLDELREKCVVGSRSQASPLPPEQRSYLHKGSYGIGLLSSEPFGAQDEKRLDASTVRRGILYARLDGTALGTIHVFCTQLTAVLSGLRYEGSYDSWQAENARHTRDLIAFVREKTNEPEQVLLLGDLNNGPVGKTFVAQLPENYAQLTTAGFLDPYAQGPDGECTFCKDNPLVHPGAQGADAMLDHIMTGELVGEVQVERIFEELIDIGLAMASDSDGGVRMDEQVSLSDHYGLRATFNK